MLTKLVVTIGLMATLGIGQQEPAGQPGQGDDGSNRQRVRERRQDRGDRSDRGQRRDRSERRDRGDREVRGPRDGEGPWSTGATPEERQRRRVDQMVEQATRLYELDDMQRVQVRQAIESMQAERRAQMGADADTYDQLRARTFEYWQKARDGAGDRVQDPKYWEGVRASPELADMRRQMREIESRFPFNFQEQLKRIETMLPPEQVEKGRERWQGGRARFDADGRMRMRTNDAGGRRRVERNEAGERTRVERADRGRGRDRDGAPRGDEPPPLPPPPPPHPWEVHTRQFMAAYQLTESQAAAALGVLKDMRQRAEQVELLTASRVAQVAETAEKKKLEDDGRQQVDRLFDELKQRLESLLTAAQRAAGPKP